MRVRILRGPTAGRVVILPEAEALALLQAGAVEEDKMLDGPTELKGGIMPHPMLTGVEHGPEAVVPLPEGRPIPVKFETTRSRKKR